MAGAHGDGQQDAPAAGYKYCPKCGEEYYTSAELCLDCSVTLVDTEPPGERRVLGRTAFELTGLGPDRIDSLTRRLGVAGIPFEVVGDRLLVPAARYPDVAPLIADVRSSGVLDLRVTCEPDADQATPATPN